MTLDDALEAHDVLDEIERIRKRARVKADHDAKAKRAMSRFRGRRRR